MTELDEALKEARSFSGLTPPNNAEYIESVRRNGEIYHFYKDATGNYYYDTESGRAFEMEMQERRKKREEAKKRTRIRRTKQN